MHHKSRELVNNLGAEKSIPLYLHFPANVHSKAPDGKKDNTHFNETGAKKMASLFIEHLVNTGHPLKKYVKQAALEKQQQLFNEE